MPTGHSARAGRAPSLTRGPGGADDGTFLAEVRAIALAPVRPGAIARAVKRADMIEVLPEPGACERLTMVAAATGTPAPP